MRPSLMISLLAAAACLAPGCGNEPAPRQQAARVIEEEAPAAPSEEESPASPEAVPAAQEITGALEPDVGETAEPGELAGTKWRLDDLHLSFLDEARVFVKGGPLTNYYPEGTEGRYTTEGQLVEISVMGRTRQMQWDGTQLIIDGRQAERQ